MQKASDEPLVECPQCGEMALQKQVSLSSFALKGSGWYTTDYKRSSKDSGSEKKRSDQKKSTNEGSYSDKSA